MISYEANIRGVRVDLQLNNQEKHERANILLLIKTHAVLECHEARNSIKLHLNLTLHCPP